MCSHTNNCVLDDEYSGHPLKATGIVENWHNAHVFGQWEEYLEGTMVNTIRTCKFCIERPVLGLSFVHANVIKTIKKNSG